MSKVKLLHERLAIFLNMPLPSSLLLTLIPLSMLQLSRSVRWVLAAVPPLLILGYAFYPHYLAQYTVVSVTALYVLIVLGVQRLVDPASPSNKPPASGYRVAVKAALTVMLISFAIGALPEMHRPEHMLEKPSTLLFDVQQQLESLSEPSVVFFRFTAEDPEIEVHDEPVYNLDAADPDRARVIRVHNLGLVEDAKLIAYYGSSQPGRKMYIYLRNGRQLVPWVTASQLMNGGALVYPTAAAEWRGRQAN